VGAWLEPGWRRAVEQHGHLYPHCAVVG